MKCPICGKEVFDWEPVYVSRSSYGDSNVSLEMHICYNCGNVVLKSHKFDEYKRVYREYKELIDSKKALEKELDSLMKANKSEFDKFDKLNKVRDERNSLPEEKNDDAMLKDLLLKKKANKIEASFNREFLAAYGELKHKIGEIQHKISKISDNTKRIIEFVEFNHLENY